MFVPTEPIAIAEGEDTIYIRPKMGRGVEAQVSADFVKLGGKSQQAYETCLLYHNIVKWEGPSFETKNEKGQTIKLPCSRQNIDLLDPGEPLIQNVIDAIVEANKRPSLNNENPTKATPT